VMAELLSRVSWIMKSARDRPSEGIGGNAERVQPGERRWVTGVRFCKR